MTEPQKKLVKQWVDKALNDLLNVTNNLNADHTPWDKESPSQKPFKGQLDVQGGILIVGRMLTSK